jgi:hypothetical protein
LNDVTNSVPRKALSGNGDEIKCGSGERVSA